MPRRRRAFIDRSNARTYEVVYRPLRDGSGSERVFRVVDRGNASAPVDTAADQLEYQPEAVEELPYERSTFELGEYGFADDGYNYSKHFKKIGGKGGVFIPAANGEVRKPVVPEAFELREDDGKEADAAANANADATPGAAPPVPTEEDLLLRATAIEEIQKGRKVNPMLDEVFALLDSDGELDAEGELGAEGGEVGEAIEEDMEDDADEFPDDFVGLASGQDAKHQLAEGEGNADKSLEEKEPASRPQRALDDQFDELMKAYEAEDEDSELEEDDMHRSGFNADDLSSTDADSAEDLEVETGLNEADLQTLLGIEGLTLEAAADEAADSVTASSSTGARGVRDDFRPEEHAEAQLDNAMDKLMDSYKRVPADAAFAAIDAPAGSRRATVVAEASARQLQEEERAAGADASSCDEELDSMVAGDADERDRWDCETIVSTYSNLDNHPSVIDDADGTRRRRRAMPKVIRLDPRTQMPVDGAPKADAAGGQDGRDFGTRAVAEMAGRRRKGETKEEKRLRKEKVKEAKREGRVRKREMKKAFAEEAIAQNRHAVALGKSKVAVQL